MVRLHLLFFARAVCSLVLRHPAFESTFEKRQDARLGGPSIGVVGRQAPEFDNMFPPGFGWGNLGDRL